jgi:hypothetical protein
MSYLQCVLMSGSVEVVLPHGTIFNVGTLWDYMLTMTQY